MSKLQTRIENLEEQTGMENVRGCVIIYTPDGSCKIGAQRYENVDEARAANPATTYVMLPDNGRDG